MVNFHNNNTSNRLESPTSKRVLNQLGRDDQSMYHTSKHNSLFKHNEFLNASNQEQYKLSEILKAKRMRNDILSKSHFISSREFDCHYNPFPPLDPNDFKKFELIKMHNINEIKTLIDLEVYKVKFKKLTERKMKMRNEKDEERYRKQRLKQRERKLKNKYSLKEEQISMNNSSIKKKYDSTIYDSTSYIKNNNYKEGDDLITSKLISREENKRRLNDMKTKIKRDEEEKERQLKDNYQRLHIEKRNKERIKRSIENERKVFEKQKQSQSRSLDDIKRKIQDIETKRRRIEDTQKRNSINLKKAIKSSNDIKKIKEIELNYNTQKKNEDIQNKRKQYNSKQELYNQRAKEKDTQTEIKLKLQLRLANLRKEKIKENINNNKFVIENRNSYLLQKITQIEEKALKIKEQKSKEKNIQCRLKGLKQEKNKEKINEINMKSTIDNYKRIIQYTNKINKIKAWKEENVAKMNRRQYIESEIKKRKEVMLRKVSTIADFGFFNTKYDFYRKVFNSVEYNKYLLPSDRSHCNLSDSIRNLSNISHDKIS